MTNELEKVLCFFKEISSIPRSSRSEEKIATYLEEFANTRHLECYRDAYNNVLIKKKGTGGHDHKTLILHAHMDMVCVKTNNSNHDFDNDPIEMVIDGDTIMAKDTSLGADDGIGMSFILYLLDSALIHPNLECLFTTEEETTYNGASNFDYSKLSGKALVSFDNYQDDTIVIGCAGSIATQYTFIGHQEKVTIPSYKLVISNLIGGNAGIEIENNKVNAITLMANLLDNLRESGNIYINTINGGKSETDITSNIECVFSTNINNLEERVKNYIGKYPFENEKPEFEVSNISNDIVFSLDDSNNIIDEIISLSKKIITRNNEHVITSENIGVIETINNQVIIKHLLQSKNENELLEYNKKINYTSKEHNFTSEVIYNDNIWKPQGKSLLKELYEKAFYNVNKKYPITKCIQAGVECGVFAREKKDLDIILVGTIIENFHTTNERIYISSCEKTLKNIMEFIKLYNL